MILEERKVAVKKSGDFEQTEFRIDGKYKNKVLWMLINQYRHKVRTPVQEIVSNARDAQRENGNPDKPIKVQIPTKIDPTFIVRDYGVGMDENRIKTIFTSFGASTKNGDNGQTGGFGIGAKSPLAYTDSFNIKTYVDGKYWFYVIAKTENDGIGINLLDTGDTSEENGTEVQIPVNMYDTRDFLKAVCRCTMFWDIKPVFNLPDEELYNVTGGTKISNELTVFTGDDLSGLYDSDILMVVDGIPYEVDRTTVNQVQKLYDIKNMINYSSKAVFFINTGDIDLLQTRESIEDTQKTTAKLTKLAFKGLSDIILYIESCFTETTLEGRLRQFNDVSGKFRGIKTQEFETVKIGSYGVALNKDLKTVTYSYKSKTGYNRVLTTPQRHVTSSTEKSTKEISMFYYDDLGDKESETLKNRRMRYNLTEHDLETCLVEKGDATTVIYDKTIEILNAKKLSSLELPPKKERVKNAKGVVVKKAPELITPYVMRVTRGWESNVYRNKQTLRIADISTKFVYLAYSEYDILFDSKIYIELLEREYGIKLCKLTITDVKNIKGNKNFTHLNEFKKSFKPTKNMITSVISSEVSAKLDNFSDTSDLAGFIIKNNKELVNKTLTKLAQCVKIESARVNMLRNMESDIIKENKVKIDAIVKASKKFKKIMDNNYSLVNTCLDRKENIFYINSKGVK